MDLLIVSQSHGHDRLPQEKLFVWESGSVRLLLRGALCNVTDLGPFWQSSNLLWFPNWGLLGPFLARENHKCPITLIQKLFVYMCLIMPAPYPWVRCKIAVARVTLWSLSLDHGAQQQVKHLRSRSTGDEACNTESFNISFLFAQIEKLCPAFFARFLGARIRSMKQWKQEQRMEGDSRRKRKGKARQTGVCVCVCLPAAKLMFCPFICYYRTNCLLYNWVSNMTLIDAL